MNSARRKIIYSQLLFYSYLAFAVVIFFLLWPLDRTNAGYLFIFGGLASLAMLPLIPEGITKAGWNTEWWKRKIFWSGIAEMAFGLAMSLLD